MMDVRLAMLFASLLSLIPSFGLLTLATWWFENKMDEKDLNITFIIGIFAGIAIVVLHLFLANDPNVLTLIFPFAFLASLSEVLLYHVYVNRKKLRGRSDSPFMTFSFALGIAGAYLLFTVGRFFVAGDTDPESVMGLILFSLGLPLARSGTALLYSGERSKRRSLMGSLWLPTLVLGVFNTLALLYILGNEYLWPFSAAGAIVGTAIFAWNYKVLSRVPDRVEEPN